MLDKWGLIRNLILTQNIWLSVIGDEANGSKFSLREAPVKRTSAAYSEHYLLSRAIKIWAILQNSASAHGNALPISAIK
jgi:hypothetical protein